MRDYRAINIPLAQIGHFCPPINQFNQPRGMCIDNSSDRVYIIDKLTNKIIICSIKGDYIDQYGNEELTNPESITLCDSFVFITNSDPTRICKYDISNFSLVSLFENLSHTFGIASENSEIYVSQIILGIIAVFNVNFDKIRELGNNLLTWCWSIQVSRRILFALEVYKNKIIKLDSQSGELLGIISINQDGINLYQAFYFTLDNNFNIFISDNCNIVKILDPIGNLLKAIDTNTFHCSLPRGLAVNKEEYIFISFRSGSYSLIIL